MVPGAREEGRVPNVDSGIERDTLRVVREYYGGWTSGRFESAAALLAPDLAVEVPVNDYPTKDSFVRALVGFGGLVRRVTVLAEFVAGQEAMLLYDMDVEPIGRLRVAEHFTIAQSQITRIRQIHDTVALRAAGFAPPA